MDTISCPCCGDPMPALEVVCWECYRATNRLTPGQHDGLIRPITQADTYRWDAARSERLAESR